LIFLHVTWIKDKQMLAFNFIFELLWTGRDSSVSSVAFLGFRELKWIEKHDNRFPTFMNLEFRDFDLSLSHF